MTIFYVLALALAAALLIAPSMIGRASAGVGVGGSIAAAQTEPAS